MASRKKMEERQRAQKAKQTERTVQFIGLGIVILLVIAGVWFFSTKDDEPAQTGQDESTQTSLYSADTAICERFAEIPAAEQYSSAPPMGIDPGRQYFANVKMATGGEFEMQLYPDKAPRTVNSFVFLSCKGYFNGVTFHRVLDGFMAQGGDPTGTGMRGPGYEFEDEFSDDLAFDKPGLLAMANSGPNTNGSQFFITYAPTPHLNGRHTIFGQVTEGMDVVNTITRRDPDQNPDFAGDAIETITITEQ
ncbi:MAG: peptidylprolyl isomerase [Chloroflexota bacterium]